MRAYHLLFKQTARGPVFRSVRRTTAPNHSIRLNYGWEPLALLPICYSTHTRAMKKNSSWHRDENERFVFARAPHPAWCERVIIYLPTEFDLISHQTIHFFRTHTLTHSMYVSLIYLWSYCLSAPTHTHVSLFSVLPRAALRKKITLIDLSDWENGVMCDANRCDIYCWSTLLAFVLPLLLLLSGTSFV